MAPPSRTAPSRSQGERTAATVAALVSTARRLFAADGFAAVGTEQIARQAGVSRGALYHQFADKTELFAAVLDQVERDIAELILRAVTDIDPNDTEALLLAGADAFLDACAQPGLRLIVLIDGPSVLGWARWREICLRHSVGLISALLADGIDRGNLAPLPVDSLTHVLVGAVDEAALYVAEADDPGAARADMDAVLRRLVGALIVP